MLEREIVQKFLDRLCNSVHYNVNVMNCDGVIIAARDAHRKGVYHALAHQIVTGRKDSVIAQHGDDLPDGVLPGVNLPVCQGDEIIGVVGVTGDYREVESVAYALKTSLETMVEYEEEKEQLRLRQDSKRQLARALLYERSVSRAELLSAFEHLGYDPTLPRIALILHVDSCEQSVRLHVEESSAHTRQDIRLTTREGSVVVFKAIDDRNTPLLTAAVEQIEAYWLSMPQSWRACGDSHGCYCGSLQTDPLRYRDSYQHALWLFDRSESFSETPVHFLDFCMEYALSQIPEHVLSSALMPFFRLLSERDCDVFVRTFEALNESNMSLKGAASLLKIHRNTVVLRLQRLRQMIGLDPVNQSSHRELMQIVLAVSGRLSTNGFPVRLAQLHDHKMAK